MPCLMPCVWTERGNLLWAMRVSYCVSISHIRNPPAPVWRGNSLIFKVWFSDAFHRTTVWAPITKSLSGNGWTPYNLTNEKSPFVQVIFWCRRQQAINRTNTDPDLCRHIASLSHNELDKGVFPMNIFIRQWPCPSLYREQSFLGKPEINNWSQNLKSYRYDVYDAMINPLLDFISVTLKQTVTSRLTCEKFTSKSALTPI